jgi:hypothetical protein
LHTLMTKAKNLPNTASVSLSQIILHNSLSYECLCSLHRSHKNCKEGDIITNGNTIKRGLIHIIYTDGSAAFRLPRKFYSWWLTSDVRSFEYREWWQKRVAQNRIAFLYRNSSSCYTKQTHFLLLKFKPGHRGPHYYHFIWVGTFTAPSTWQIPLNYSISQKIFLPMRCWKKDLTLLKACSHKPQKV